MRDNWGRRMGSQRRGQGTSKASAKVEPEIQLTPTATVYKYKNFLHGIGSFKRVFDPTHFPNSCRPQQPCLNEEEETPGKKAIWFVCVLWNLKVLKEFELHEEMQCKLYTPLSFGKLLVTCVKEEKQSWPGLQLMDWKQPFVLVDIIDDNRGDCGSHRFLRVQETIMASTVTKRILWDLVIHEEVEPLVHEMIRRCSDKVKTTVMLWGAQKCAYLKPWFDGNDYVKGEILLMPNNDPLSVLIFHHESISQQRIKQIQIGSKKSELWEAFQHSTSKYKWYSNSFSKEDDSNHFSFHAMKYCKEGKPDNDGTHSSDEESFFNSFGKAEVIGITDEPVIMEENRPSVSQDNIENDECNVKITPTVDVGKGTNRQLELPTVFWGNGSNKRKDNKMQKRNDVKMSNKNEPSTSSRSRVPNATTAKNTIELPREQNDEDDNYRFTALIDEM